MRKSVLKNTLLAVAAGVIGLGITVSSAFAQVEQPSRISIQGTGLFTRSLANETPSHEASKSGGFLVGYSYQFNSWLEAQGNYGYSRNTQNYNALAPTSVQADFHELTGTLVAHLPFARKGFEPYALGGAGTVIFDPTEKFVVIGSDRQARGAFVYGGGANFRITHAFGVRGEYRGLIYKVPDFGVSALNLDKFTHLAQPSAGLYFRF